MKNVVVFAVVIIVALRTMLYGAWTLKGKNILGGCFVLLLATAAAVLAAYFLFRGGT